MAQTPEWPDSDDLTALNHEPLLLCSQWSPLTRSPQGAADPMTRWPVYALLKKSHQVVMQLLEQHL